MSEEFGSAGRFSDQVSVIDYAKLEKFICETCSEENRMTCNPMNQNRKCKILSGLPKAIKPRANPTPEVKAVDVDAVNKVIDAYVSMPEMADNLKDIVAQLITAALEAAKAVKK